MKNNWMRAGVVVTAASALALGMVGTATAEDENDQPTTGTPNSDTGWILNFESGKSLEAGLISLNFENGDSVPTYCIDAHTELDTSHMYAEGEWDESNVANLEMVNWVLHNAYPTVDPATLAETAGAETGELGEEDIEQAAYTATQAAVWNYTDEFALDTADATEKDENVDALVAGIYSYLVDNAEPVEEPNPEVTLDGPETIDTTTKNGPFTADTPGSEVAIEIEGGKVVDADDNEIESVKAGEEFYILPDEDADQVVLNMVSEVAQPTGSVFMSTGEPVEGLNALDQDESQKLILGKEVTGEAGTEIVFDTESGSTLPVTGSPMTTALIAGAALLAAGAGLVVVMRRRRIAATWGDAA